MEQFFLFFFLNLFWPQKNIQTLQIWVGLHSLTQSNVLFLFILCEYWKHNLVSFISSILKTICH